MPELPEVETIVRELREGVCGKTIRGIDAPWKKVVLPSLSRASAGVKGRKISDVVRRGKFIVFVLERGMRLVVHLRMTGRLMWTVEKGRSKFVRAIIRFADGTSLYFSDVRKFGRVWVYPESEYEKRTGIGRLGEEPLDIGFKEFRKIFSGRRGILKNSLLRQDLLAGVGNIYADETCFRIGAHPSESLEKLSPVKVGLLYSSVRECLEEGIEHCGVSVSDFVGTRGTLGKHQHYLNVYGREGERCNQCSDTIKRTVVAGRGTYYCPTCQELKGSKSSGQ